MMRFKDKALALSFVVLGCASLDAGALVIVVARVQNRSVANAEVFGKGALGLAASYFLLSPGDFYDLRRK